MNVIKQLIGYTVFLGLLCISCAAFVVVYQSSLAIEIIEYSLARHVAQYLIEKPTQSLVVVELTTLHAWLLIVTSMLFMSTIISGFLFYSSLARKKRGTG